METSTAERFAEYPFATDVEFQVGGTRRTRLPRTPAALVTHVRHRKQGLAGILGNGGLEGKSDAEKAELVLRSKVFYFNR